MNRKRHLSLLRIIFSVVVGWAAIILLTATFVMAWRLTISPATAIADFIVPAEEVAE